MCLPFGSHCVCNNQINKAFLQFSNCEVINQPQIDQSGGFDLPKPTWNLSRSFVIFWGLYTIIPERWRQNSDYLLKTNLIIGICKKIALAFGFY